METMQEAASRMTDDEKWYYQTIWDEATNPNKPFKVENPEFKITYFFPDKYKLVCVDVYGLIPSKDDVICFDSISHKTTDERYNFSYIERRSKWKVKSVHFVIVVQDDLKRQMLGFRNLYRVEVQLKSDWTLWKEFKFRLVRKKHDILRSIKNACKKFTKKK